VRYKYKEVIRYKRILGNDGDFWIQTLRPIEFCIAYWTRETFYHRKIVDNFKSTIALAREQQNSEYGFHQRLWQNYFKSYVVSQRQAASFFSIFIEPCGDFIHAFSEFDEKWAPMVIDAQSQSDIANWETLDEELTTIFCQYRNQNYWPEETDWKWFFSQYLTFLTKNATSDQIQQTMEIFRSDFVQMRESMKSSGWEIDYPFDVWDGETLIFKIKVWWYARQIFKKIRKSLMF